MDRSIPTEEVLAEMRASDPPVYYLVGTPKGRLGRYEAQLLEQPWQTVRAGVQVKLLAEEGEWYVLAESKDRVGKERSMRPLQLKGLVKRLKELAQMELTRDQLLLKLGAAKNQFPATWRLVTVRVPDKEVKIRPPNFTFALRRDKLRQLRRREGRYLLRSNLSAQAPEKLWQFYIQLTQVAAAFKELKDDLSLRPIFHSSEQRIEAHIFVSFLACCLHVSLRACLRPLAPGVDPALPVGAVRRHPNAGRAFSHQRRRELVFSRYTQPERDHKLLLAQLGLGTAAAIATTHHPARSAATRIILGADLLYKAARFQAFSRLIPSSCESRPAGARGATRTTKNTCPEPTRLPVVNGHGFS